MTTSTIVQAHIDKHIEEEASTVLAKIGLTVSDAFHLLLIRVAQDKVLPFEPIVPNKKTLAALKKARHSQLMKVAKVDDILENLNEDRP